MDFEITEFEFAGSNCKYYRKLKDVVCEMSCRQLNAKFLTVENYVVSFSKRETSLVVNNHVLTVFFFPCLGIIGLVVENYRNCVVSGQWFEHRYCVLSMRSER